MFNKLKEVTNEQAIVYRYGGEEISIINLTGNIIDIAENCRKSVEDLKIDWSGKKLSVTISIGISINNKLSQGCKLADHALYFSKENGRNQVTVHNKEIEDWFIHRNDKE